MQNKLFAGCLVTCLLTPSIRSAIAGEGANTVEQWGIYEIALQGPTNGNPFVDVRLSAAFDNGIKRVEARGFYDGDGVYRIRFMPDTQNRWRYETKANRWELTGKTGEFKVTPPAKGNRGPVHVHNTYHFAYADGTPFKQIGTTIISGTSKNICHHCGRDLSNIATPLSYQAQRGQK